MGPMGYWTVLARPLPGNFRETSGKLPGTAPPLCALARLRGSAAWNVAGGGAQLPQTLEGREPRAAQLPHNAEKVRMKPFSVFELKFAFSPSGLLAVPFLVELPMQMQFWGTQPRRERTAKLFENLNRRNPNLLRPGAGMLPLAKDQ